MKTTLEIPDELFRRAKVTAALRGQRLKELVNEALRGHLDEQAAGDAVRPGWRGVFGGATAEEVAQVDAVIEADLERIDRDEWR